MSTGRSSTGSGNRTLAQAKRAKQDEFYTQLADIENELKHYKDRFQGRVVLCNCDDPFESNFFKYFAMNFNALGLKKLVCTSYDGSPIAGQGVLFAEYHEGNDKRQKPKAVVVTLEQVKDETGDGTANLHDVELFLKRNKAVRRALKADDQYPGGDFRSKECVEILKTADIAVTNPPFSLFREYVAQPVERGKQFLIIGNKNAITYKEIFKLIKENELWVGVTPMGVDMLFEIPDYVARAIVETGKEDSNYKIVKGKVMGRSTSTWFTNIDNLRRHEKLQLFKKYSPEAYPLIDNYDSMDVDKVADIPADFGGRIGVPITFLDRYNPSQFEMLAITKTRYGAATKTYPKQVQISKDGTPKEVTKLNDAPAVKLDSPPVGETYYKVGDEIYSALYQRLIVRRKERPRVESH
ncbi:MAG: DNA methyltransferase [Armatimonadetes bacterium]|nr:DNA methyltransferase [Armatimonadota bacterium]NOG92583.1 DNA methyltransferase [Armatimonadota bacterium]